MNIAPYSKAIAAACGAISLAVADNVLDVSDVITVVLAVLTVVGVYAAPNQPTPAQGDN